jgi:hypothetical protein
MGTKYDAKRKKGIEDIGIKVLRKAAGRDNTTNPQLSYRDSIAVSI